MPFDQDIRTLLNRQTRRLRRVRMAEAFALGMGLAPVLAAALAVGAWALGAAPAYWTLLAAPAGAILGVGWGLTRCPSRHETAVLLDRCFGLADILAACDDLLAGRIESPLAERIYIQALESCREVLPDRPSLWRSPARTRLLVGLGVLIPLALCILLPAPSAADGAAERIAALSPTARRAIAEDARSAALETGDAASADLLRQTARAIEVASPADLQELLEQRGGQLLAIDDLPKALRDLLTESGQALSAAGGDSAPRHDAARPADENWVDAGGEPVRVHAPPNGDAAVADVDAAGLTGLPDAWRAARARAAVDWSRGAVPPSARRTVRAYFDLPLTP